MKTIFSVIFLFLIAGAMASAITIGFDNLPSGLAVPTNYDGFVWNQNFDVVNGSGLFSPYHNGIVSPNNAVINIDGRVEEISDPYFNLQSAYLSVPSLVSLPIGTRRVSLDVQGFFDGNLLYDERFILTNEIARLFVFDFTGIDDVTFTATTILSPIDPGNPEPFLSGIFVMDNLTVSTPDSTGTLWLLSGSVGILICFRKGNLPIRHRRAAT